MSLVFVLSSAAAAAEPQARFMAASPAHLARPHDLVLSPDGRFLYVADLGHDRIAVLDPDTLEIVSEFGGEDLSAPHDVAFDAAGRLLVADTGNDRIAMFTLDGAGGRLSGSLEGGLSGPEGVALDDAGRVYVANARGHDVAVFEGGKVVARRGKRGGGTGEFVRPHDIHVSPEGSVYVADPGNDRIQVLGLDLEHRLTIGGSRYDFNEPKYFDVDRGGFLIVADEYNHKIKILDRDRKIILTIGEGTPGLGENRFNYPEGAERDRDRLWISDTRNHRIVLYRLTVPGG